MKFSPTHIEGVSIVDLNRIEDERGFFSRAFCRSEFEKHNLESNIVQANTSFSRYAGTLRGLHYQVAPALESKFVRCIAGAIFDVVVDLRAGSPTYRHYFSIELTAQNRTALFVPENFAHGFMTLADNSEVLYTVSGAYTPECERGLRYDDPAVGIEWPRPVSSVSEKDESWPLLE